MLVTSWLGLLPQRVRTQRLRSQANVSDPPGGQLGGQRCRPDGGRRLAESRVGFDVDIDVARARLHFEIGRVLRPFRPVVPFDELGACPDPFDRGLDLGQEEEVQLGVAPEAQLVSAAVVRESPGPDPTSFGLHMAGGRLACRKGISTRMMSKQPWPGSAWASRPSNRDGRVKVPCFMSTSWHGDAFCRSLPDVRQTHVSSMPFM